MKMKTKNLELLDSKISGLSVAQILVIYRSCDQNEITGLLTANRLLVRLVELVGEEQASKFITK